MCSATLGRLCRYCRKAPAAGKTGIPVCVDCRRDRRLAKRAKYARPFHSRRIGKRPCRDCPAMIEAPRRFCDDCRDRRARGRSLDYMRQRRANDRQFTEQERAALRARMRSLRARRRAERAAAEPEMPAREITTQITTPASDGGRS